MESELQGPTEQSGFDYRSLIREMAGRNRADLTWLLARANTFQGLVRDLAQPFEGQGVTKVAALDALGFALGGAVALHLGAGLVLIRKGGKSAWESESLAFTDYTHQEKRFEIAIDAVKAGDKVLIVDDWSETGAQFRAAATLIERLGATVAGAAFIHAEAQVREDADLSRYKIHHVIESY